MAGKIRELISRRRLQKLSKKGKVSYKGDKVKPKAYGIKATKQQRETLPGSEEAGKVTRKAVGAERTKGGSYAKYKKGGKESKSFNVAYKAACGSGGKGRGVFGWQGRTYKCGPGSLRKPTPRMPGPHKLSGSKAKPRSIRTSPGSKAKPKP